MPDREALQEIKRLLADLPPQRYEGHEANLSAALARVRALLAAPPAPDEQVKRRTVSGLRDIERAVEWAAGCGYSADNAREALDALAADLERL